MPTPLQPLAGATTALITIECQNGIVGAQSALPELSKAATPILPVLGRLAEGVRAAGGRVFHLTYVPILENRSSNRKPVLFGHVLPLMQEWTADHPAAQVVDEIGVDPRDVVLPRHSGMSPTASTELFPILRNTGFTTVILGGVSLNVAVPVVATHATDEGFDVVVPTDGVAGTPEEYGRSILRHTVSVLARLASSGDILAALGQASAAAAAGS